MVNEAFNEDGTYRETVFYNTLGPGYIADALRWAHQADPKAKLYLNDYNIEAIGPKSDAYDKLAQELKAQGVPLDGIGLQARLALQFGYPTTLEDNLRRFARLRLDTALTEVDIRMYVPADEAKLATQAEWYRDMTEDCLAVRRCVGITLWDYTDKYSWIPAFFEGQGAALPWDEQLAPKPVDDHQRDAEDAQFLVQHRLQRRGDQDDAVGGAGPQIAQPLPGVAGAPVDRGHHGAHSGRVGDLLDAPDDLHRPRAVEVVEDEVEQRGQGAGGGGRLR
ncbi:hypothetical protein SALBM311S_07492 [Streptomyces alboniger]